MRLPVPPGEHALSPEFEDALDKIASTVPRDCDFHDAVPLFRALHYLEWLNWTGERASPGPIMRYLVERHGWSEAGTERVAFIWSVVGAVRILDADVQRKEEKRARRRPS